MLRFPQYRGNVIRMTESKLFDRDAGEFGYHALFPKLEAVVKDSFASVKKNLGFCIPHVLYIPSSSKGAHKRTVN